MSDTEMGHDRENEAESYHEATTVNGIEISVGWDSGYNDYTIYFPQIDIGGDEAIEKGVADQVLRLSHSPEVAKKVYNLAVELAQKTPDVYELYKKIEAFARSLPHDRE